VDVKRKVRDAGYVKMPGSSEKKKLALIIDDDKDFLDEASEMLRGCGYKCILASSCNKALRSARRSKPDMILLDIVMREKNGFHVADELKRSPLTSDIPVIAITGWFVRDSHEDILKAHGVSSILMKPFDPNELISCINHVLDGKNRKKKAH
jgi:CheY-like chemotaxis protein